MATEKLFPALNGIVGSGHSIPVFSKGSISKCTQASGLWYTCTLAGGVEVDPKCFAHSVLGSHHGRRKPHPVHALPTFNGRKHAQVTPFSLGAFGGPSFHFRPFLQYPSPLLWQLSHSTCQKGQPPPQRKEQEARHVKEANPPSPNQKNMPTQKESPSCVTCCSWEHVSSAGARCGQPPAALGSVELRGRGHQGAR